MLSRNIITFDPAKAFLPLKAHFEGMGYVVMPFSESSFLELHKVAAHFTCFYGALRRPLYSAVRFMNIRKHGVPIVAWNRDAPHYLNKPVWKLILLERLEPFDLYGTHSIIDGRHFGADTFYFPNAADFDVYGISDSHATLSVLRNKDVYEYDVSFVGSMNGREFKELRSRQDFFEELGIILDRKGISYLFREAAGVSVEDQISIIQKSRINLNFGASCDYGYPIPSGLPERCYGVPAAGGFLLCDKRTHVADDFTVGENWAEFSNLEDCVSKIDYWLDNFELSRDIAEKCHFHVKSRHTYKHRVNFLLSKITNWHELDAAL